MDPLFDQFLASKLRRNRSSGQPRPSYTPGGYEFAYRNSPFYFGDSDDLNTDKGTPYFEVYGKDSTINPFTGMKATEPGSNPFKFKSTNGKSPFDLPQTTQPPTFLGDYPHQHYHPVGVNPFRPQAKHSRAKLRHPDHPPPHRYRHGFPSAFTDTGYSEWDDEPSNEAETPTVPVLYVLDSFGNLRPYDTPVNHYDGEPKTIAEEKPRKADEKEDESKDKQTEKTEPKLASETFKSNSPAFSFSTSEKPAKESIVEPDRFSYFMDLLNKPQLKYHSSPKDEETSKSETDDKIVAVNEVKVSAPQTKSTLPFSPPINIYDFNEKYIVVVSLPGVSKDFVTIDYQPTTNELVIEGEATNPYVSTDEQDDKSFIMKVSEQRFGKFKRVIKLPVFPGVDENEVKAKFINGMLEIKSKKIDESQAIKKSKRVILEDVPDEELERETQEFI